MANIFINDVKLTPDIVVAGKQFIISVEIKDKIYGILDSSGKYLMAEDGKIIEKLPRA